jgi:hypothetical protein
MHKAISLTIALLISGTAAAQSVYKCVDDKGRPTFSQRPCGAAAKQINVEATTVGSVAPDATGMRDVRTAMRRDDIERDIRTTQDRIDDNRAAMDRELAALRAKKTRANNNLAGATWEQSISTEMDAVTSRYNGLIDQDLRLLDRLRDELAANGG